MRVVVVGAGPIGVYCAVVLARQGHRITVVDRDPGPAPDGAWNRRGVMQFQHPHFFRPQVADAYREAAPDVWAAVLAAGARPVTPPGAPPFVTAVQSRRSTVEAALRAALTREAGVAVLAGHADRLDVSGGRVAGVVVGGSVVAADLVLDASGRVGRLTDHLRAPATGGSCGFAYVSRMYRQLPGVDDLAATTMPMGDVHDGYLTIVFPQDAGTLSTLIVRPADDPALATTRHREHFDAVMRAVPKLARWTDPERFQPITDVLVGGNLTNTYRGQLGADERVPSPGVVAVGDSVSTTNPMGGRGVALGLGQAAALVRALTTHARDIESATLEFDAWCEENIRPWFEDHVRWDASLLRRFAGDCLDLDAPIPSDVICAAAEKDPEIGSVAGPYQAMFALPAVLRAVEERARAVLRTGWRPVVGAGPSSAELADELARVDVSA